MIQIIGEGTEEYFQQLRALSASVGTVGFYTWGSTAQMISDVQGWKNNPSVNYGWLLLGDESASATAKDSIHGRTALLHLSDRYFL